MHRLDLEGNGETHPASVFNISSLLRSQLASVVCSPAVLDSHSATPRGEVANWLGPPKQRVRTWGVEAFALNQIAEGLQQPILLLREPGSACWDGRGHGWGGSFIPVGTPKP